MDQWEELVLRYRFSLSDLKTLTVRERVNWLVRSRR